MSKKILIVEDEADIIEFMTDLLTDQGYEIDSAMDGHAGFEKVRSYNPDLILLDIQMPEETGVGMFRRMYREKDMQDIPVIVVSGMAGANWAISARIPVIDKPIDEKKLLDQIEKSLSGQAPKTSMVGGTKIA